MVHFDYTNVGISTDESLIYASKSTRVKKLKFNLTVGIVLQNTALSVPHTAIVLLEVGP